LPSVPADLDELDWVVDEEVSGTLIYPGENGESEPGRSVRGL